ncbi:MAG TPA: hypothetical protein DDZ51_24225 [Planctomycetaceae bacterium]|nr:hypothetical protein [Planctomycetaceae bacterium]
MKLRTKTGPASYDRMAIKRRLLVETLCDRRVLASLSGVVFDDVDQSWRMESGETALAQRLVFIDENNSGLPDDGERYLLTDNEGGFAFDELGGDEQIVRLLTRAASQVQHFPVATDSLVNNKSIDLTTSDLFETASGLALFGGSTAILRADAGLIHVDLGAIDSTDVVLNSRPTGTAMLPDGRLLILANDLQGNFAFTLLGQDLQSVDLLNSATAQPGALEPFAGWASVAVDADGDGVLVPQSFDDSAVELHRLTVGETLAASSTSVMVAAGTTAIGGGTTTTLIAQPADGGLALSLWSNSTATLITPETVTIAGASEILGYNDASGLVFAWVPGGDGESSSIKVLDADANFVTLQTISELDGLVAVDTQRSVIFSLSDSTPILQAIDALTTQTIARWELASSFASLVDPVEMVIAPGGDELAILVAGGIATIALTQIDAHRVRTDGLTPIYPLRFAVRVAGENAVPRFESVPSLIATQGVPLILGEGTLKEGAIDDDEDPFVVVRASSPSSGSVRITPGGAVTYTADLGFVGVDSFQVFLHDGRGASELTTIEVTVLPVVEPTPEVIVHVNPVPENALAGFVAATIQTIALGNRPLVLTVNDPRFVVVDNMIIVGQGAVLNFEASPLLSATLTASDSETGEVITATAFTVTLSDENDPITDVQPRSASVYENRPGEILAVLTIEDEDADEEYTFDVFDNRFEVIDRTLKLREGISLDFEMHNQFVVTIAVADTRGGMPFLFDFTVFVLDVDDSPVLPVTISLTNASVVEYARGAAVGTVLINGQSVSESELLTVDDSRFEIVGGVLRLRDGVFLIRADQQEAQVVITTSGVTSDAAGVAQTFLIEVLENVNPFHNPERPFDVNGDDEVTPLDALLILQAISEFGGTGSIDDFPPPGRFWDVNGDGLITPLDSLLILNYLNLQSQIGAIGEPEGGSPSDLSPSDLSPESDGKEVVVEPLTPIEPSVGSTIDAAEDLTIAGPAQADSIVQAGTVDGIVGVDQRFAQAMDLARLSLPSDFLTAIPQRLRDFRVQGLVTDGKLDSAALRERLINLLRPSDWQLLERISTFIRRTPIDQATIDAVDRALMAINAGWDDQESV